MPLPSVADLHLVPTYTIIRRHPELDRPSSSGSSEASLRYMGCKGIRIMNFVETAAWCLSSAPETGSRNPALYELKKFPGSRNCEALCSGADKILTVRRGLSSGFEESFSANRCPTDGF